MSFKKGLNFSGLMRFLLTYSCFTTGVSKMLARLLGLLFLALPFLQVLHHHNDEFSGSLSSKKTIIFGKCSTCDYLCAKHDKQTVPHFYLDFSVLKSVLNGLSPQIYVVLTSVEISFFTNRGPPPFIS